jgi:hypothetical protein
MAGNGEHPGEAIICLDRRLRIHRKQPPESYAELCSVKFVEDFLGRGMQAEPIYI